MKLWFRLIYFLIATWFRPRIHNLLETSCLSFRVWPTDLDLSLHMNNGRYLTLMDLGRLDLMVRSPLWRAVWKNRWTPVVATALIRFRRELRCFEPFVLETKIVDWSETDVVFEQRMIFEQGERAGQVAAYALIRAGLYDRKARGYVPVEQLMELTGFVPDGKPSFAEGRPFSEAEAMLFSSPRVKRR